LNGIACRHEGFDGKARFRHVRGFRQHFLGKAALRQGQWRCPRTQLDP
jgi:hypothetical protein